MKRQAKQVIAFCTNALNFDIPSSNSLRDNLDMFFLPLMIIENDQYGQSFNSNGSIICGSTYRECGQSGIYFGPLNDTLQHLQVWTLAVVASRMCGLSQVWPLAGVAYAFVPITVKHRDGAHEIHLHIHHLFILRIHDDHRIVYSTMRIELSA